MDPIPVAILESLPNAQVFPNVFPNVGVWSRKKEQCLIMSNHVMNVGPNPDNNPPQPLVVRKRLLQFERLAKHQPQLRNAETPCISRNHYIRKSNFTLSHLVSPCLTEP